MVFLLFQYNAIACIKSELAFYGSGYYLALDYLSIFPFAVLNAFVLLILLLVISMTVLLERHDNVFISFSNAKRSITIRQI